MTMTTPIHTHTDSHGSNRSETMRPSPHGFDRAVHNIGNALVKWSQARAERATISREDYERLVEAETLRQQRESNALQLHLGSGL